MADLKSATSSVHHASRLLSICRLIVVTILVGVVMLLPHSVHAQVEQGVVGVGVGSGKITVDESLYSGKLYTLPPLSVVNTGTVPSKYTVAISYHEQQEELRPDANWFNFAPREFSLQPGEVRTVEVVVTIPLKVEPGNYFAYLEASPLKGDESSDTHVGIAAAAKLYFSVEQTSFLYAVYYRLLSLYQQYTAIVLTILVGTSLFIVVQLIRKYFRISVQLKPSSNDQPPDHQ